MAWLRVAAGGAEEASRAARGRESICARDVRQGGRATAKCTFFPGSGAALSALSHAGSGIPPRPVVFLSGSPWNLHARLAAAFKLHGLPDGAFILRRFSKEPQDAYAFKLPHLRALLAAFPQTKWVLFGEWSEVQKDLAQRGLASGR